MSIKNGQISAKKMWKLISIYASEAFRNGNYLDELNRTAAMFEEFCYLLFTIEPHITKVTSEKFSAETTNRRINYCFLLTDRENTLQEISFDLGREIGESIRSLTIGNYSSVYRSLRWVIESCMFWADMQTDKRTGTETFDYYYNNELSELNKKHFLYLWNLIRHSNLEIFRERLFLKEKHNKPQFNEIVNKIVILKNASDKLERHIIRNELLSLYSFFSGFSHISIASMPLLRGDEEYLRSDYAIYQDYDFQIKYFEDSAKRIGRVIDLSLTVIVLTLARFYGYSNPNEFLKNILSHTFKDSMNENIRRRMNREIKRKKLQLPTFDLLLQ